jgi:hypothetical protein
MPKLAKNYRKIRKAKIKNTEYKVEWRDLGYTKDGRKIHGEIDLSGDDRVLSINTNLTEKDLFCVCVHEFLHGILPKSKEKTILKFEEQLVNILWSVGFRLK